MIKNLHINGRSASKGIAFVEFALILPLLLLLVLAIYDFSRAIQANLILVNISREGANLSSRTSDTSSLSYQNIMTSIASTAPPLDMKANGMIYITAVKGQSQGSTISNIVLDQYRLGLDPFHNYSPHSAIWNCGDNGSSWDSDNSCKNIPTGASAPVAILLGNAPSAPNTPIVLADGELVYAVDVFYRFNMLFGGMKFGFGLSIPQIGPDLHAMSVF